MNEPYHLPWDVARCLGAESDDPELVYRAECDACLRRLAPPHPTRDSMWIAPQPEPCEYRIIPWYDPD